MTMQELNAHLEEQGTSLTTKMATVVTTALIGVFLIYGVGFAQPNMLHNAAHDTRHSLVFPCH